MAISVLVHLSFASQLTLGIVFLFSALSKLRKPTTFARAVVAYDVLPKKVSYAFGLALIPLETFLSIALLTGFCIDTALPATLLLSVAFLGAVLINLQRKRHISCGCFGHVDEHISHRTAARLLLLITLILLVIAAKSAGDTPLSSVADLPLAYLFSSIVLAVFMLLFGAWVLHLPEWFASWRVKGVA